MSFPVDCSSSVALSIPVVTSISLVVFSVSLVVVSVVVVVVLGGFAVPVDVPWGIMVVVVTTTAVAAAVEVAVVEDAVTSAGVEAGVVVVVVHFVIVDRSRLVVAGFWGTFEQMNDN